MAKKVIIGLVILAAVTTIIINVGFLAGRLRR